MHRLYESGGIASGPITGVQLAYHFVSWEQLGDTSRPAIFVLDVARGAVRYVGGADSPHQVLGDYVLNPHGTVVFIMNFEESCGPYAGKVEGYVQENSLHGFSTLDSSQSGSAQSPMAALALSTSGLVAYWTDNGQPRSAPIP